MRMLLTLAVAVTLAAFDNGVAADLTADDIVTMHAAGIGEAKLLLIVDRLPATFDLSAAKRAELKRAGVPETVIAKMTPRAVSPPSPALVAPSTPPPRLSLPPPRGPLPLASSPPPASAWSTDASASLNRRLQPSPTTVHPAESGVGRMRDLNIVSELGLEPPGPRRQPDAARQAAEDARGRADVARGTAERENAPATESKLWGNGVGAANQAAQAFERGDSEAAAVGWREAEFRFNLAANRARVKEAVRSGLPPDAGPVPTGSTEAQPARTLPPPTRLGKRLAVGENWVSPITGMDFVWIADLNIWAGVFEVTNGQYRVKMPGHDSGSAGGHSLNGERQPVVRVNFEEARAYAEWLTARERAEGILQAPFRYRLPSDQEWTALAQCGDERVYPWGNHWPPRHGEAGNYHGQEGVGDAAKIPVYTDGFPVTAPVDMLWANPWGLRGVGGNVWEAAAADGGGVSFGAWRGGSWYSINQEYLRSDSRHDSDGAGRGVTRGFRLVLSR